MADWLPWDLAIGMALSYRTDNGSIISLKNVYADGLCRKKFRWGVGGAEVPYALHRRRSGQGNILGQRRNPWE